MSSFPRNAAGRPSASFRSPRFDLIQIKAVRPQFAFKANPSSGRMRVVEMGGFAVKPFAAMFFLKGTCGQADMGLGGRFAFFERIHVALPTSVYVAMDRLVRYRHHLHVVLFGAMI